MSTSRGRASNFDLGTVLYSDGIAVYSNVVVSFGRLWRDFKYIGHRLVSCLKLNPKFNFDVTRIAGIDCYVEFNSSVDPRWNVPPAHGRNGRGLRDRKLRFDCLTLAGINRAFLVQKSNCTGGLWLIIILRSLAYTPSASCALLPSSILIRAASRAPCGSHLGTIRSTEVFPILSLALIASIRRFLRGD